MMIDVDQRCEPLFGVSVLFGDRRHRKNNIWSVHAFVCLQAACNSDLAVHKGGAVLHVWSVKCVKALQSNIQRSHILNLATHSIHLYALQGRTKTHYADNSIILPQPLIPVACFEAGLSMAISFGGRRCRFTIYRDNGVFKSSKWSIVCFFSLFMFFFFVLSCLICFFLYFWFICLVYSIHPLFSFLAFLLFWRRPWKIVTTVWFVAWACYRCVHPFEYQHYQPLDLFSGKWNCQTQLACFHSVSTSSCMRFPVRFNLTCVGTLRLTSLAMLDLNPKYTSKQPDESLMAFRCFASSESGSSSSPANRPRATISMRMFPSSNNLSAPRCAYCDSPGLHY